MAHQWIWLILSAVTAAIPFIMVKKYIDTNNKLYIAIAACAYAILIVTYMHILQNEEMFKVYPLLKIISILVVIFVGIFYFNNRLTEKSVMGIILGLIAVYLLSKH